MKKMKVWVSLLLSVCLLISLAACGTGNTDSDTGAQETEPTSEAGQTVDDDSGEEEEPAGTSDYAERLSIQIANVGPIEGYDYTAGDAYAKYWSDRYNFDVEIVGLTWDNWNEMLRIWINSMDMPDVAVFNYGNTTHPDAASFAEQGLVKQMPDDWKTRWPNAASVFEKTSLGPQMEETFGGVYFLPRARFDTNLPGTPLPNHMSLHMRRDWAEAVDFPIKDAYTISEIIEYGTLVKEADPDNLGVNMVSLALRPDMAARVFVAHNSTYWDTFYKDSDGTYKWGAASEDTLEGLKLFYEAYSSGVLHPEFYTLMNEDDNDLFRISGTAAATYMGSVSTGMQVDLIARFEASTGLDSKEAVLVANVLGEDGNYHQQDLINYWGALCFSPDIDDAVFERFMDWVDFGCTEEGYLIQVAGFEGEDYAYEDGEMVSLLPEGMPLESSEGKYPSIGGYHLGNLKLWDDFSFSTPVVDPFYRERSWDLYMNRVEMGTPESFPTTDWTVFCHDSPNRRKASYTYGTEYSNIVTSSNSLEDVEANWRAWIDSQMAIVQPVLDELNELG